MKHTGDYLLDEINILEQECSDLEEDNKRLEEENKKLKESLDIATKCSSKEED
jgi:regulator of replication initiation timing